MFAAIFVPFGAFFGYLVTKERFGARRMTRASSLSRPSLPSSDSLGLAAPMTDQLSAEMKRK